MSYTFISYSRRQYYFAEGLALHLQQLGLSVWFDIQQLEPGVNWKTDIEAGLQGCTSVTLVASRSALASPYVAREWRHALDNSKPIFVLLYELVQVPLELRQHAVIIDCRGDFEQGVQSLVSQFQNPHPSPQPITWLPHLPHGVRRMALALALHDIQRFISFALSFVLIQMLLAEGSLYRLLIDVWLGKQIDIPAVFGMFVTALGILIAGIYVSTHKKSFKTLYFLRHDFTYEDLMQQTQTRVNWTLLIGMWCMSTFFYMLFSANIRYASLVHPSFGLQELMIILAGIILIALMNRVVPFIVPRPPHPDIVRWATVGNVSQRWRLQINPLVPVPPTLRSDQKQNRTAPPGSVPGQTAEDLPQTYQVIHAPGDEKVVAEVKATLGRLGYWEANSDATWTVLILSYRTPLILVSQCLKNNSRVIGLLTTDIKLPRNLPELDSLQWVDFRSHNSQQLHASFQLLAANQEDYRARLSQNLLPVNLKMRGDNKDLRGVFSNLLTVAGINLIYIFYFIARLIILQLLFLPVAERFRLSVIGVASLLIIDLFVLGFGVGALKGIALIPSKLLMVFAAAGLVIIAGIELTSGLPHQFAYTPPLSHSMIANVGIYQTLAFIGIYCWTAYNLGLALLGTPYLLSTPNAKVLGMSLVKPNWSGIFGRLLGIFSFLLFFSLGFF